MPDAVPRVPLVRRRRRRGALLLFAALACTRGATPARAPDPTLRRDLALTPTQARYLAELAAAADAAPEDGAALRASGIAHMQFTLSGVLSLRDRAERDLEAALRLRPDDRELARALGRFYNLRAVERDATKASAQVAAYRAYLGELSVPQMNSAQFVGYAFSQLGHILELRDAGRMLAAFAAVRDLEGHLRERTAAHPDDLELWAVAGNFAFFFAGNIPTGKRERVETAVRYFTRLRERWDELRAGARDPEQCPNTYENFMFELAEGHVTLGQLDAARPIYQALVEVRAPVTRAKQQIAYVSAERLRNLDRYSGKFELMPPWPSDVGNCVVCHSYTSDVPLTTLYSLEPMTLDAMPRGTVSKPVADAEVPDTVRAIVAAACLSCHVDGPGTIALDDDDALLAHRGAIGQAVASRQMPPRTALAAAEIDALVAWANAR